MESRVFERKFYEKTLSRKRDKDGSTVLLIKGARELWQRYPERQRHHLWKEHTFRSDGYFVCSIGSR